MAYYSDEEELDIRVRRGRGPPVPQARYVDPRIRERIERERDRAAYYQAATGGLVIPNRGGIAPRRSLSRSRPQHIPAAAPPVIINNHVDNYYDDDVIVDEEPRYYHARQLVAVPQHRSRSHHRRHSRHGSSHSRSSSGSFDSRHSHHELEKTRKELEKFKMKEKQEHEERIRKEEEELARLKAEQKRAKEAKERKEAEDKAIKEWQEKEKARIAKEKEEKEKIVAEFKKKEEERIAKEKKAKEEEEKKYKEKVEADMKKAGMTDHQIAAVLKKEKAKGKEMVIPERPTYTRMARRHISIETLRAHHIDFEFDIDQDYVIIKRWVPEYEQDFLWNHTRQIRETRHHHPAPHNHLGPHNHLAGLIAPLPPPHHGGGHHGGHGGGVEVVVHEDTVGVRRHREDRLEFVRKRRPSPSPLLKFFAGGR